HGAPRGGAPAAEQLRPVRWPRLVWQRRCDAGAYRRCLVCRRPRPCRRRGSLIGRGHTRPPRGNRRSGRGRGGNGPRLQTGPAPAGNSFIEAIARRLPASRVRERTVALLSLDHSTPIARVAALVGNGSEISAQDTVPLVLWCAAQHLDDYESALWPTVSTLG